MEEFSAVFWKVIQSTDNIRFETHKIREIVVLTSGIGLGKR